MIIKTLMLFISLFFVAQVHANNDTFRAAVQQNCRDTGTHCVGYSDPASNQCVYVTEQQCQDTHNELISHGGAYGPCKRPDEDYNIDAGNCRESPWIENRRGAQRIAVQACPADITQCGSQNPTDASTEVVAGFLRDADGRPIDYICRNPFPYNTMVKHQTAAWQQKNFGVTDGRFESSAFQCSQGEGCFWEKPVYETRTGTTTDAAGNTSSYTYQVIIRYDKMPIYYAFDLATTTLAGVTKKVYFQNSQSIALTVGDHPQQDHIWNLTTEEYHGCQEKPVYSAFETHYKFKIFTDSEFGDPESPQDVGTFENGSIELIYSLNGGSDLRTLADANTGEIVMIIPRNRSDTELDLKYIEIKDDKDHYMKIPIHKDYQQLTVKHPTTFTRTTIAVDRIVKRGTDTAVSMHDHALSCAYAGSSTLINYSIICNQQAIALELDTPTRNLEKGFICQASGDNQTRDLRLHTCYQQRNLTEVFCFEKETANCVDFCEDTETNHCGRSF